MSVLPSNISHEKASAILTKAASGFVPLWRDVYEIATTEELSQYYEVTVAEIVTTLERHYWEFEGELDGEDGWTPRAALRLGMLLNCPIGRQVRSLALDLIEALSNKQKREQIKQLFENVHFTAWSDRDLGRTIGCDHKTVGRVRKELEELGAIEKTKQRTCRRNGATYTRTTEVTYGEFPHMSHIKTDVTETEYAIIKDDHPHYAGQRVQIKYATNPSQKLVILEDGTTELISNHFLLGEIQQSSPPQRNRVYSQSEVDELLAQQMEQHQREKEQLEKDVKIQIIADAREKGASAPQEELNAVREVAQELRKQNLKLQLQVDELQALRGLEAENDRLKERIYELERAVQFTPVQKWEPELHLRAIATHDCRFQPKKLTEVFRLIEMSLANIVLNSPEEFAKPLWKPVSEILRTKASREAIAAKLEDLKVLPQALTEFRQVLQNGKTWAEFEPVTQKYQSLRFEIWGELEQQERNKVKALKDQLPVSSYQLPVTNCSLITDNCLLFQVGTKVAIADPYSVLYNYHGTVKEIYPEQEEVLVRWEEQKGKPNECKRYSTEELRVLNESQELQPA